MNKISFGGIKNPGAYTHYQSTPQVVKIDNSSYILPKGRMTNLYCELTNENGKDLEDFKYVLKARENKFNPNAINIGYEWMINPNNGEKLHLYSVNDILIDLNDKTFNLFNKIFKLLKKISEMPREQIFVDNSYLKTQEVADAFSEYTAFPDAGNINKIIDAAHKRDNVLECAKKLSEQYAKILTEYVSR